MPLRDDAFLGRRLSWALPQAVNLLTSLPFVGALEQSYHVLILTLTFGQRPGTVQWLIFLVENILIHLKKHT